MNNLFVSLFCLFIIGCNHTQIKKTNLSANNSSFKIVPVSDVKWEKLNPLRGDKSPQAGTLWGNRKAEVPTGFLAKFVDGFSSPPHIHNATYRAVVISGLIHNDDPKAEKMWMPIGSFWTQPKGEVHITAAKGKRNIALVEIDKGPYLVLHKENKFDSGERPVNIVANNLVWINPKGYKLKNSFPKIAYLWGNIKEGSPNGTFLKLPSNFSGQIASHQLSFKAVVIRGSIVHNKLKEKLEAGSYFSSKNEFNHQVNTEEETIL